MNTILFMHFYAFAIRTYSLERAVQPTAKYISHLKLKKLCQIKINHPSFPSLVSK